MASWELELHAPPEGKRQLELWLQHAVGRILIEDVRGYATERIDQALSVEARSAARKGIDDALYGLMMVLDGVSGALVNESQRVEIAVQARLVNRDPQEVVAELDLMAGDGMCMGYHGWLEGDYGKNPVVVEKAEPKAE
jgi:hypothetical protein